MAIQISCINKIDRNNPHERITFIGGINSDGSKWKLSLQQAILDIENGKYNFYVNVNGQIANVIISSKNGYKYLKTENDGEQPNNLLSLPDCP